MINFIKKNIRYYIWKKYIHLMRINKPEGFFLLLWPVLWSFLILNKESILSIKVIFTFIIGAFLCRSSGCIINDYMDYKIDKCVKRTRYRPLAMGIISRKNAITLFFLINIFLFLLVFMLKKIIMLISVFLLCLICIYPLMKRYIFFPQVILAITFSIPILMLFIQIIGSINTICVVLFLINILWTIAFDTQYSMMDKIDDIRIGVKSVSVYFKKYDFLVVGILHILMLLLLILLGYMISAKIIYYILLIFVLIIFLLQQILMSYDTEKTYYLSFVSNNFIGLIIFISILYHN